MAAPLYSVTQFYRTEKDYDNETYTLKRDCAQCGVRQETTVKTMDVFWWRQGKFVQDAFSSMTPANREMFFLSGICGNCFDNLYDLSRDGGES